MAAQTKQEYLQNSRGLATGFGRTVDFADAQVGTTVQSEGGIGASADELPGQVFSPDQLPDPEIARAYGLPPVQVPEHLITDTVEDAENHIQGKDSLDRLTASVRADLKEPVLAFDNTVVPAEEAKLSLSERTGENAFGGGGGLLSEDDPRIDDTGSGQPIDPEGVQKPDAGGTESVPAADGGTANSKSDGKGGTQASGKPQAQGKPTNS